MGVGGNYWIALVVVLLVIYIHQVQYSKGDYETEFLDDILPTLRTGDIILFKASNNFNSVFFASYYGHMGTVLVRDGEPYIFEANGVEHMPLLPHHNPNGIFFTKLRERVQKYKGRVFVKRLSHALPAESIAALQEFVDFALENMCYDINVFQSVVRKVCGNERYNDRTNCAELVLLSLIKMGLLPWEAYERRVLHVVRWMAGIKDLEYGYSYADPVEILDHPFDS